MNQSTINFFGIIMLTLSLGIHYWGDAHDHDPTPSKWCIVGVAERSVSDPSEARVSVGAARP